MGRGEVAVHPRVRGQPGLDGVVLVGGVVVHHQVQLPAGAARAVVGVGAGDLFEKGEDSWCRGLQAAVT